MSRCEVVPHLLNAARTSIAATLSLNILFYDLDWGQEAFKPPCTAPPLVPCTLLCTHTLHCHTLIYTFGRRFGMNFLTCILVSAAFCCGTFFQAHLFVCTHACLRGTPPTLSFLISLSLSLSHPTLSLPTSLWLACLHAACLPACRPSPYLWAGKWDGHWHFGAGRGTESLVDMVAQEETDFQDGMDGQGDWGTGTEHLSLHVLSFPPPPSLCGHHTSIRDTCHCLGGMALFPLHCTSPPTSLSTLPCLPLSLLCLFSSGHSTPPASVSLPSSCSLLTRHCASSALLCIYTSACSTMPCV